MAHWRSDFPISSNEDSYVTRREFTKFLGLTSVVFAAGTLAAAVRKWWKSAWAAQAHALPVAAIDEIPIGGYKLFRYPTENDPCILVRLAVDRFAAYDQRCTHLTCPVHFNASTEQLVCPCHHGYFSAQDGRSVAGPPRRPLERLDLSIDNDCIFVRRIT